MVSDQTAVKFVLRLDDIIAPVHVGLKALMLLLGDVLPRPPQMTNASPELPKAFFGFDPAPGLKPSRRELNGFIERRIMQWALSDAVESVKPLLVRARAVCAFFDHGPGFSCSGDEWNAMMEGQRKLDEKMSGLPIDQRLKIFGGQHPDFRMPPLLPEILSILKMRNCILHNSGLVSKTFCNDPGSLNIRFKRWSAWVIDPAGDREYVLGELLGPGTRWQVRFVTAEQTWRIGEIIDFSNQMFIDVCVTIDRFAVEMAKSLEEYGRLRGIPFEGESPTGNGPTDPAGAAHAG
jgi:hypothetical protein